MHDDSGHVYNLFFLYLHWNSRCARFVIYRQQLNRVCTAAEAKAVPPNGSRFIEIGTDEYAYRYKHSKEEEYSQE